MFVSRIDKKIKPVFTNFKVLKQKEIVVKEQNMECVDEEKSLSEISISCGT